MTDHTYRPTSLLEQITEGMLFLSLVCLVSGLFLPAISIETLGLWTNPYSIVDGIRSFFNEGQVFLGGLVLFFSVVLPLLKVAVTFLVLGRFRRTGSASDRVLGFMTTISKWAMADVFILALVVLVLNGQVLTSSDIHLGIVVFTVGVLLSNASVFAVRALASRS